MIIIASIRSRCHRERGLSPAVELAVLLPALLLLLGIAIAGARIWSLRSTVTEAAYSGARAASLERSADRAGPVGRQVTAAELERHGVQCRGTDIGSEEHTSELQS